MSVSLTEITRHDFSLFAIAVAFLLGLLVAQLFSIQLFRSLFVASLPAGVCVGYVLFYNPPDGTQSA